MRSALHPKNGVSAAFRARAVEAGRSIASSRRSQSRAEPVYEHAPGSVDHRWNASSLERVADRSALAWVRTSTAMSPAHIGSASCSVAVVVAMLDLRAGGQQPDDVGREVLGDVLRGRMHRLG